MKELLTKAEQRIRTACINIRRAKSIEEAEEIFKQYLTDGEKMWKI